MEADTPQRDTYVAELTAAHPTSSSNAAASLPVPARDAAAAASLPVSARDAAAPPPVVQKACPNAPVVLAMIDEPTPTPSRSLSLTERGFEARLVPHPHVQTDVSVDRAMQLMEQIYHIAGPKIGSKLVEPCHLLALAGLRASDPWNGSIHNPTEQDLSRLDALNRLLAPQGISIKVDSRERFLKAGTFKINSLAGLERVTRATNLPYIPRYDSATGWEGRERWEAAADAYVERLLPNDPVGADKAVHARFGVELGYPDRAILDVEEGDVNELVGVEVHESARYETAEINFLVHTDNLDHPEVAQTLKTWGDFLTAAYAHPAHRRIASRDDFQAARRERLKEVGDSWSQEKADLGLVDPARPDWAQEPRKMSHEILLRHAGRSMAAIIRAGGSLEAVRTAAREAAERAGVRYVPVTDDVIDHWTRRGLRRPEGAAGELASAVKSGWHDRLAAKGRGLFNFAVHLPKDVAEGRSARSQAAEIIGRILKDPFLQEAGLSGEEQQRLAAAASSLAAPAA